MPQPQSLTDFSVTLAPAQGHVERTTSPRSVRRFAEVKARVTGSLPYVTVGSVYEDMDPRCVGRRVEVLGVSRDARVLVRVLQASDNDPKTASGQRRDTVHDTQWIAQIRFREGSRGFKYLYRRSAASTEAYLMACEFATVLDRDLTVGDLRLVSALCQLLPGTKMRLWMNQWERLGTLPAFYAEHGPAGLLANAAVFDTRDHEVVFTSRTKAARTHSRAHTL